MKSFFQVLLHHTTLYVKRRPKLRGVAIFLLNSSPALRNYFRAAIEPVDKHASPINLTDLPLRTREIYARLKVAIDRRHAGTN